MLVLSRRPGDAILIELPTGELIEVVVVRIKGDRVRFETDAPPDVPTLREELLEDISEER